jgi:hypothetical protein
MDAAEAGDARSSDQTMQHRFGLIVSRMCGGDYTKPFATGDLGQERIAPFACLLLHVSTFRDRAFGYVYDAAETLP